VFGDSFLGDIAKLNHGCEYLFSVTRKIELPLSLFVSSSLSVVVVAKDLTLCVKLALHRVIIMLIMTTIAPTINQAVKSASRRFVSFLVKLALQNLFSVTHQPHQILDNPRHKIMLTALDLFLTVV